MFFKGSRYATVPELLAVDSSGRTIRYKAIRFIPQTPTLYGHLVTDGDRLDRLAGVYLNDPEKFWRLSDANFALWPPDLLAEPGTILGIPAAEDRV
jgi:hypothetical protein